MAGLTSPINPAIMEFWRIFMLQPISGDLSPEFLTIGHATYDIQSDGSFTLGGTVTFAALTAYRLGLVSAIVTRAGAQLLADLPTYLPEIGITARLSAATTTFANTYHHGFRTQYIRARADLLDAEDIHDGWSSAPIVLLAPLDQELTPELLSLFPRRPGAIIAATPQGWLRDWDEDGRVWPTPWASAEYILPLLDVLILSHDDLLPFADGNRTEADAILSRWSLQIPLLVATDGQYGATLFQHGITRHFPAYPAREVDPTGAGDVFAASFLVHFYRHGNPHAAVDFANCVSSLSIEHEGITGIPSMEAVNERMRRGY
jgi:1D-myo-inositol 3-kinase